jgi:hypothetical protein
MANLLAAGTELPTSLPIPPAGYALLAFGTFLVLLAVLFAFRSVGNRH